MPERKMENQKISEEGPVPPESFVGTPGTTLSVAAATSFAALPVRCPRVVVRRLESQPISMARRYEGRATR
jgi:hypothetical protein